MAGGEDNETADGSVASSPCDSWSTIPYTLSDSVHRFCWTSFNASITQEHVFRVEELYRSIHLLPNEGRASGIGEHVGH